VATDEGISESAKVSSDERHQLSVMLEESAAICATASVVENT